MDAASRRLQLSLRGTDLHLRGSVLGTDAALSRVGLDLGLAGGLAVGLLSLVMRPPPRVQGVRCGRHFRKLRRRLCGWMYLSLFWNLTGGRTFTVRSSDPWWQPCANTLMSSSDVILVELTEVKAGTIWELGKIAEHDLTSRTIFIAHEASGASAESTLDGWARWTGQCMPRIFLYGDDGRFCQSEDFDGRIEPISVPDACRRGGLVTTRVAW